VAQSHFFAIFGTKVSMENSPELQKQAKYLGTITSDFAARSDTLKEASYQLRVRGFAYPIFPICKEPLSIGQLLLDPALTKAAWYYNVSYLEEFVQRGLVAEEERFREAYKDPDEYCCLFVVDKELMSFIFLPYPND
jgi:hypothetical protein